jgi:predicted HicB family RNase H-like nuclease
VRQIEAKSAQEVSRLMPHHLRPPTLKELVETAAEERGESLNTWLLKTLSTRAGEGGRRRSRSVTGTIDT